MGADDLNPAGSFEPAYRRLAASGELSARADRLEAMLTDCQLCPRACRVDRTAGELGTCGSAAGRSGGQARLSSFGPHYGEESPLVGRGGSGTIFFAHCNLLCTFCQNWEIAHSGEGREVGASELAAVMLDLQGRGCHNVNFVTPTHVVPQIVRAVAEAAGRGLNLPLVFNCGGYESLEVLALLDGVIDVYMPDFKFQDDAVAGRLAAGATDYPEVARAAVAEMHRQVGLLDLDDRGVARRGLLIRHLVLPENQAGTDRFVRWVAEALDPATYVNIMAQYRPCHGARHHPDLLRGVSQAEMAQAFAWAREAGLSRLDR